MEPITVKVYYGIDSFLEFKCESIEVAKQMREWLNENPLVSGVFIHLP